MIPCAVNSGGAKADIFPVKPFRISKTYWQMVMRTVQGLILTLLVYACIHSLISCIKIFHDDIFKYSQEEQIGNDLKIALTIMLRHNAFQILCTVGKRGYFSAIEVMFHWVSSLNIV